MGLGKDKNKKKKAEKVVTWQLCWLKGARR